MNKLQRQRPLNERHPDMTDGNPDASLWLELTTSSKCLTATVAYHTLLKKINKDVHKNINTVRISHKNANAVKNWPNVNKLLPNIKLLNV